MNNSFIKKIAFVINGKGGSGKDTVCDLLGKHYNVHNISSITPIKEIAKTYGGWDGGKTEKDRKFLSDLKKLFTEYNDLPNHYCVSEFKKFMASPNEEVFFAHIREPENIDKFIKSVDGNCLTLLIRGGMQKDAYGNRSDDEVENYTYDYIYNNTKPLEDVEKDFLEFFHQVIQETEKRYYPHEQE